MSSKSILTWPFLTAAFFAAGLICLASPGWAGLLLSRTETVEVASRTQLEREIVIAALHAVGWSRPEAVELVAGLTNGEIEQLAAARMTLAAGGDSGEKSPALGVAVAIVVVLALITGLYLFSSAD